MKIKDLLNQIDKKTWTKKVVMTERCLGLVILVAAVAGATATALTKRTVKCIALKITTPRPG